MQKKSTQKSIQKNVQKNIFKVLLVLTIIAIIAASIKFFHLTDVYKQGAIEQLVGSLKTVKGTLLFLALYAIRPVFVILPSSPMAIAGGAVYGTILGTAIVVVGALLSGTLGFFMARLIGKDFFDKISHHHILQLKRRVEHGSWATVIFLNFIGLPWDIVSIASGLSKIRYRDFFIGIAISSVPQSFIAVYLGDVLSSIHSINDIFGLRVLIVAILVVLGIGLPHMIKGKIEGNKLQNKRFKISKGSRV